MELVARTSRSAVAVLNQGDEILQNAINSFRQVLTPDELSEFNNIQSLPDTDAVLVFTTELDLRRQSQKGKSIASRLFPVLQAVHSFTGVIDTFVSSNPVIAALVWGSVKMTIQIMLNAASYYEAFAELFMSLGTICPRFEQYQALFPTSTRLQAALCNFNASIIRCCQRVIQIPKRSSGWTSPLNPLSQSFWYSFQQLFESNLQELRDYSKNVKEEIRLAQAESEHRNRELQRMEGIEAEKSRKSLGRFMSRTRTQFDTMHQSQLARDGELEREKNQKLLDSLYSHDYLKPFKQARQKRYPQSASWIFDTNEFKSWAEGNTSALLWCSGKMGSGKTILAANVIDILLTERSEHKRTVAFFFSRFDEAESLKAETALRAVVRQIISFQDIPDEARVALEDIQNANEDVFRNTNSASSIYEWPRDERRKLLQALSSIGREVKVFATSRDSPDSVTEDAFPNLNRVSMNCFLAQESMAQLVDQAVQKCVDAEELLVNDQRLIDDIQKTLTDNADGMILWVTLVLRDLCTQPNNEKIREAISLKNLPKSLTDVFDRALQRIISGGKEGITQAILPWIAATKEPLSLSQLEECCHIRVLQQYTIKDRYVNGVHLVDSWFQGLVEVDPETKTIHFVHSSVQKFFCTEPVNKVFNGFYVDLVRADRQIGEVIITCLNFNDFKKALAHRCPALPPISPEAILQQALGNEFGRRNYLLRGRGTRSANIDGTIATCTQASRATVVKEHPFLSYASKYWLSHSFNFNRKNCQVWQIWKDMLMNGHKLAASPVSEVHHQFIDEALTSWAISTGHCSLLYVAATSRDLLDQFRGAMFDNVIDENNVELLSRMLKIKSWRSALSPLCCRAARHGLLVILKVLADAGVGPNERDYFTYKVPLIEAIEAGQVAAIELLLALGADPNVSTRSYRNALKPAVDLGGSKGIHICKILIEADTAPNGSYDFTALSDDQSYPFTALQRACTTGQEKIVGILLKAGANPNYYDQVSSSSPLELAIEAGHIEIIRLLLAFDADVNRKDLVGVTPLLIACYCLESPRLDIVELLFKGGAKMDREQSHMLLQRAAGRANWELLKILIREGASLNRPQDYLKFASDKSEDSLFEIIQVLLDAGAPVADLQILLLRIPLNARDSDEYKEISRTLYNRRS